MNPIEEILNQYPNLPHKFLVRFALYCANDVRHLITYKLSIQALDTVQLWLDDKATKEDLIRAKDNAFYPAVYFAAYAAFCGDSPASYAASCAASAANAANAASKTEDASFFNKKLDEYLTKLLEMIEDLDPIEKMLYL